jgi:GTPase SAR1 family protein
MKLAIIGAHRVGKTTLAEKLQELLPGYQYQPEPYYALEETGYIFADEPNVEDYRAQFELAITHIYESEQSVIFDRCPIDLLAYIHVVAPNIDIQDLFENAQQVLSEIDLLVFVPIEQADRIDCTISELPELREEVNEMLMDWIWDLGIEVIEVSGTPSARADQVIKWMSNSERI